MTTCAIFSFLFPITGIACLIRGDSVSSGFNWAGALLGGLVMYLFALIGLVCSLRDLSKPGSRLASAFGLLLSVLILTGLIVPVLQWFR